MPSLGDLHGWQVGVLLVGCGVMGKVLGVEIRKRFSGRAELDEQDAILAEQAKDAMQEQGRLRVRSTWSAVRAMREFRALTYRFAKRDKRAA